MATCEQGHPSISDDYCDVCGRPIRAAGGPGANAATPPSGPNTGGEPSEQRCANCGAFRDGRFCEACGHDARAPVQAPGRTGRPVPEPDTGQLVAVVRADRTWYEEVRQREGPDIETVEFPRFCPERRFTLTGPQLAIGRRSRTRGTEPDIDLSGPPLDPGVSAQQALLIARPDGGWDIVDLGSTNGTTVGEASEPIPPGVPFPLCDGEQIRLGAWTTITITSTPDPGRPDPEVNDSPTP